MKSKSQDIKPSNILVTLHGDKPVPKVIDFGIAKATQQPLTEKTIFTQFQHFIGTPAYMSPEQASLSGLDIDTRSDIYGLGVLLYELLTGTTPFDGRELLKSGLDEMRRVIREREPLRPSTRLSTLMPGDLATAANQRAIEAPRLIRTVRGDLDWIALKCLEKDRARRYGTVNNLAADIDRHLHGQPVAACPPSATYRITKAVKRNKGLVIGSAAVVAALMIGFGLSVWQAVRATRAEREQARERARAERRLQVAVKFVDATFNKVSEELARVIGAGTSRQRLAEAGAAMVEELMQGDPPNAEFRQMLGDLNVQLAFAQGQYTGNTSGEFDSAHHRALEAIRFYRPEGSAPATDLQVFGSVRAEMIAGITAMRLLRNDEALLHFRQMQHWAESLATRTNGFWSWRDWREDAKSCVGNVLFEMGHTQALESYFLPRLHQAIAKSNDVGMTVHHSIGLAYRQLGRYDEALPHLRESLRVYERLDAREPRHIHHACERPIAQADLGYTLALLGQFDEGIPLLTNAITLAMELYRKETGNAGFSMTRIEVLRLNGLGRLTWMENTPDPAERCQRLDEAEYYFSEAERLVARLKSPSLRNYILQRNLNPSLLKLREAQTKFEASTASGDR